MSLKMECHFEMDCHLEWNVTQNEMSLKMDFIQYGISLKIECHSKRIVTPNRVSQKIK